MSIPFGCYRGDAVQKFNITAGTISIMDSRFANFASSSNGGCIYANSSASTFASSFSSFYNCSVTGSNYGGAFCACSSSFSITGCCFFCDIASTGNGFYAGIASSGSLIMNDTSFAKCCPTAVSGCGPAFIERGFSLEFRINNTDNKMNYYGGCFYNYFSLGVEIHYIQMIRITAISSYEIYLGSGTPLLDTGNIINNTVSYGICRSSLSTIMRNFVVNGCGTSFVGASSNGGTVEAIGCFFDVAMASYSWLIASSCNVSKAPSIQIVIQSLRNCADGSICSEKYTNRLQIPNDFSSTIVLSVISFLFDY